MATWVGYPRSYTAGRARAPQFVTLHYTAGSEGPQSAENGAAYDKNRTDGTSCHYFVDSAGPALQEVPDGDRSHSAYFHGNEIGIHIELCGTIQTRAQWLDPASYATLVTAAALVRDICQRNGFALRRLTVAETRDAYYGKGKPTGINDHATVTAAFPEDGGDHSDVGPEFPWDVFMALVIGDAPTLKRRDDKVITIVPSGLPASDPRKWMMCDGMFCRLIDDTNLAHAKYLAEQGAIQLWSGGTPWNGGWVPAFGVPVDTLGSPVTPEQLEQIKAAAKAGAGSAPVELSDKSLAAVRTIVDQELDEQALGGADKD